MIFNRVCFGWRFGMSSKQRSHTQKETISMSRFERNIWNVMNELSSQTKSFSSSKKMGKALDVFSLFFRFETIKVERSTNDNCDFDLTRNWKRFFVFKGNCDSCPYTHTYTFSETYTFRMLLTWIVLGRKMKWVIWI